MARFVRSVWWAVSLTPRSANQSRALLVDIFNHAASKGLCPDNPASSTINRIEKKQRKRHTVEGLKAVREVAPPWLRNAIDLALITLSGAPTSWTCALMAFGWVLVPGTKEDSQSQ